VSRSSIAACGYFKARLLEQSGAATIIAPTCFRVDQQRQAFLEAQSRRAGLRQLLFQSVSEPIQLQGA